MGGNGGRGRLKKVHAFCYCLLFVNTTSLLLKMQVLAVSVNCVDYPERYCLLIIRYLTLPILLFFRGLPTGNSSQTDPKLVPYADKPWQIISCSYPKV